MQTFPDKSIHIGQYAVVPHQHKIITIFEKSAGFGLRSQTTGFLCKSHSPAKLFVIKFC